jgi:hypothetical protein
MALDGVYCMHMDKDLQVDGVTKGFFVATGAFFSVGSLLKIYVLWHAYGIAANCLSGSGADIECSTDSLRLFPLIATGLICLSFVLGLVGAVRILALRAKARGRRVYDIRS